MFDGAGAESLCCQVGTQSGYALTGGAGANLPAPDRRLPVGRKTIFARDVAFPMVDPYLPIAETRAPVPGLNAWPGRRNRPGRRYYGLTAEANLNIKDKKKIEKVLAKPGFAGMGTLFSNSYGSGNIDWLGTIEAPPVYKPPTSSGGIDWNKVFGGIFSTLPSTISSITGHYDPLNRTPQQVAQQQQFSQSYGAPPEGYHYNSSGQLVRDAVSNVTDFITENPLLVGGAVLGVVLLFMKSPARR